MICDCQCENSGEKGFEYKSETCNTHGDLTCGICVCHDGYFGKNCECGTNDRGQMLINEFACRRDNSSNVDCGGRGTCECNVCNCNTRDDPTEVYKYFPSTISFLFLINEI
jgi:integrin beta 1